jgi:voltage-gated potassium channel Kch
MNFNIIIAACMMVATTVIHAGGMVLVMQVFDWKKGRSIKRLTRIYLSSGVVVMMFLASVLEVLVWAITYLALNAIQDFEQAFYFSMVTFTTLGYGDVVLAERWRLLSSFEAANGIIMFGWTTAIVIAAVQRIYFSEGHVGHHQADSGNKQ